MTQGYSSNDLATLVQMQLPGRLTNSIITICEQKKDRNIFDYHFHFQIVFAFALFIGSIGIALLSTTTSQCLINIGILAIAVIVVYRMIVLCFFVPLILRSKQPVIILSVLPLSYWQLAMVQQKRIWRYVFNLGVLIFLAAIAHWQWFFGYIVVFSIGSLAINKVQKVVQENIDSLGLN